MKGIITRKDTEKGFGFITPDGVENTKNNNIFFFKDVLEGITFEDIQEGNPVEFEVEPSNRGPRAVSVKRV